MSDRFFLDTNIFVYSVDPDDPAKQRRALELIRTALHTRKGIISYQVMQEFFNVVLRSFSQPMTLADAEQYLAMTFRSLPTVHSSYLLYGQALQLGRQYSVSWYDSLIVASAIEGRCAILYSEDFQHGQKFGELVVSNPFL